MPLNSNPHWLDEILNRSSNPGLPDWRNVPASTRTRPSLKELQAPPPPGLGTADNGLPDWRNVPINLNAMDTTAALHEARGNEQQLEFIGGEVEKPREGVISRLFDILSRGNYATAEATKQFNQANKTQPWQEALKAIPGGLREGFTGREKTRFSEALEEGGARPGWGLSTLGFALDVFADPLTYTGAGILGKLGKASKTGQQGISAVGAQALKNIDDVDKTKTVMDRLSALKADPKFQALSPSKQQKKINSTIVKAEKDLIVNTVQGAERTARLRDAGEFQLKFMGQNVLPKTAREAIYTGGEKVFKPVKNSKVGQAAGEYFSNAHRFGKPLNDLRRRWDGRAVSMYEDMIKEFKQLTKGMNKRESEMITRALEAGIDPKTGTWRIALDGQTRAGNSYHDIATKARKMFEDMRDAEQTFGLLEKGQQLENYVYHFYKINDPKKAKAFKSRRVNESFKPAHQRTVPTLDDAAAAGLKPELDIRKIMHERAKKHIRQENRKGFIEEVHEVFGIDPVKLVSGISKKKSNKKALDKAVEKANSKLRKELQLDRIDSIYSPEGIYVPRHVANIINDLKRMIEDPHASKRFMSQFDSIQKIWKTTATVINPGHHARNAMGDSFLNYLKGVLPRDYKAARAMIKAADPSYQGTIKIGKHKYDAARVRQAYNELGLKTGYVAQELGGGPLPRVMDRVTKFTETREDFWRMASFVHSMRTSKVGAVDGSYASLLNKGKKVAPEVRANNIDYGDLTLFEETVLKRIIPFYTFMSRNLGIQLQNILMQPGKMAVVPKSYNSIEQLLGIDQEARDEDFWLQVPDWIKDDQPIQYTGGQYPSFLNFDLPLNDINRLDTRDKGIFQLVDNFIIQNLTPLGKIPAEKAMGRNIFTGGSLPDSGFEYGSNQVPGARIIHSLINWTQGEKDSDKLREEILNYLTGVGSRTLTDERKRAAIYENTQETRDELKRLREEDRERIFGKK